MNEQISIKYFLKTKAAAEHKTAPITTLYAKTTNSNPNPDTKKRKEERT
jgi:hypothetical protein